MQQSNTQNLSKNTGINKTYTFQSSSATYSPFVAFAYDNNNNTSFISTESALKILFESTKLSRSTIDSLFTDPATKDKIQLVPLLQYQHLYSYQIKEYILPALKSDKLTDSQISTTLCALFENQTLDQDVINLIDLDNLKNISNSSLALYKFSSYIQLSMNYIDEHKDKLDWRGLLTNKYIKFTKEQIKQYIPLIHRDNAISDIFVQKYLTDDEINELLNFIYDRYPDDIDWETVSWSTNLNEENVFKYLEYLDFKSIYLLRHYDDERITCYIALAYPDLCINNL